MSHANPSKEPSMDEILASIRRIIESGDEKPVSVSAVRSAAAVDKAAASGARLASRPHSSSAPQVVPFYERPPASATEPRFEDDSEERWLPLGEPANHAGEPADPAAEADAVTTPDDEGEPEAVLAAVEASDRWTQEFDDVQSWPVLDVPAASDDVPAEPAMTAFDRNPQPEIETHPEPELERTPELETPAVEPEAPAIEPEAVAVEPEALAIEPEALTAGRLETAPAPDLLPEGLDEDDDFVVDFNEADFVEALDRNAGLVAFRDESQRNPEPASIAAVPLPSMAPAAIERTEPADVPSALRSPSIVPAAAAAASEASSIAPSVIQEASALMSDQAGSQVAAAFDDLARAIRDGQMKSMEEMAREMLRPMLQEWLDDNLPRLVERLVREEIERVSRGGRR